MTAYAAIKSVNLQSGQWLGIVGCGGLGHLAIQFAKAMGFQTVGRERPISSLADSQAALELAANASRKHSTICLVAAVSLLYHLTEGILTNNGIDPMQPPDPWKISPLYVIHKDLRFIGK